MMLCEVPGCNAPVRIIPGVGVLCDIGHAYHTNRGVIPPPQPPPPPPRALHAPARTPATALRMPFGKHKGELIENLETGYIEWCLGTLTEMRADLRTEMEAQLEMRSGRGVVRERQAVAARTGRHARTRPSRSGE